MSSSRHLDFVHITVVKRRDEKKRHSLENSKHQHGAGYRVRRQHLQEVIDSLSQTHRTFDKLTISVDDDVTKVECSLAASLLCGSKVAGVVVQGAGRCVLSETSTLCGVPIWDWGRDSSPCSCTRRHALDIKDFTRPQTQTALPVPPAVPDPPTPALHRTKPPADRPAAEQLSVPRKMTIPGSYPDDDDAWAGDAQDAASVSVLSASTGLLSGTTVGKPVTGDHAAGQHDTADQATPPVVPHPPIDFLAHPRRHRGGAVADRDAGSPACGTGDKLYASKDGDNRKAEAPRAAPSAAGTKTVPQYPGLRRFLGIR